MSILGLVCVCTCYCACVCVCDCDCVLCDGTSLLSTDVFHTASDGSICVCVCVCVM